MTQPSTQQDAEVTREHLVVAHDLILELNRCPRVSLEQIDGKDAVAQALANEYVRGQRSRDAELERALRLQVAKRDAVVAAAREVAAAWRRGEASSSGSYLGILETELNLLDDRVIGTEYVSALDQPSQLEPVGED